MNMILHCSTVVNCSQAGVGKVTISMHCRGQEESSTKSFESILRK